MNAPQLILLTLFAASILLAANQHGKKREGTHNFWVSLIALIIQLSLMYWGGFFSNL